MNHLQTASGFPSSVWFDKEYSPRPPLKDRITADIVIVGGGISGISTAISLTETPYSVAILEGNSLASGASGRNAGFLISGTVEYYHRAIEFIGHDSAKRFWELSEENHTILAGWIAEFGIRCDYQQRGSLVLAETPNEFEEITNAAQALHRDGFYAEIVPREQLPEWGLPEHLFYGGYFSPVDGATDPVALIRGLAKSVENHDIQIFENTPVTDFSETRHGTVEMVTPEGAVESQILILAMNAYTPQLRDVLEGKVLPVRGQMLATEPVDRLVDVPCYGNFGYDYFRQLPDGRLIVGGSRDVKPDTELGYSEETTEAVQTALTNYLHSLMTGSTTPEVTHRWAGVMGFARDGLPILGRLPASTNVYTLAGFTGHGMGIATRMGQIMGALVTEGSHPDFPLVSIRRFLK